MAAPKVIAFRIVVEGVDTAIRNEQELAAAVKLVSKAYRAADYGSDKRREAAEQLARLKKLQASSRQEIRDLGREFEITEGKATGSYRAMNAELVNARRAYKELTAAERDVVGPQLLGRIGQLDKELKEIDADMGQYQRNVGNYASAFDGVGQALLDLGGLGGLASLGTPAGAIAGLGALVSTTTEATEEIRSLRREIEVLSGQGGAGLDALTAKVSAVADTYRRDASEISQAANALAEQLGISYADAVDRLGVALNKGLDINGELLDSAREYPAQFRRAFGEGEAAANAFFEVIRLGNEQGVYSDKAVDTLNEVVLRLGEMPKATRDALEAIGLDSDKVAEQIDKQGIGAAIATVAQRLGELEADAPAVGQAIADIFGEAGEVAGLPFITSLQDLHQAQRQTIDLSSEMEVQNERTRQTNEAFSEAMLRVANQVGGAGTEVKNFATQLSTFLLSALVAVLEKGALLVEYLRALPGFVRDNRAALGLLVGGLITLNAAQVAAAASNLAFAASYAALIVRQRAAQIATVAYTLVQRGLNAAMRANPIGLVVTALSLLAIGFTEAQKRSEKFRAVLSGLKSVATTVLQIVKETFGGFVEGFNLLRDGQVAEGLLKIGRSIVNTNPIGLALTEGKRLAGAFAEGYAGGLDKATEGTDALASGTAAVAGEVAGATEKMAGATRQAGTYADTIKGLRQRLEELQEQQAGQQLGSKAFRDTGREIARLQARLDKYTKTTEASAVVTEKFARDSLGFLKDELSDLQKELEGATPEEERGLLEQIIDVEGAIVKIEEGRTAIRNEIARLGDNLEPVSLIAPLDDELSAVQRNQSSIEQSNRDFQDRLSDSLRESLKLNQELQDEAAEREKERLEKRKARIREGTATIFNAFNSINSALAESSRSRAEEATKAVQRRYAAEIEAAEGNATRQEQLREEQAEAEARIQAAELERAKKYQTAAALASAAAGVINIIAAPTIIPDPLGAIFKGVQIATLAATTAIQIANIQRQTVAARGLLVPQSEELEPELRPHRRRARARQDRRRERRRELAARGTIVRGWLRGQTHAGPQGGVPLTINGQYVLAEAGEKLDQDEYGATVVINKRSAETNRGLLDRIDGQVFAGKRALLNRINTHRSHGRPLVGGPLIAPTFARGGLVSGIPVSPDPEPVIRGLQLYSEATQGGRRGGGDSGGGGISDGDVQRIAQAVREGTREGSAEGAARGAAEGAYQGSRQGMADGATEADRRRAAQERVNKRTGKLP